MLSCSRQVIGYSVYLSHSPAQSEWLLSRASHTPPLPTPESHPTLSYAEHAPLAIKYTRSPPPVPRVFTCIMHLPRAGKGLAPYSPYIPPIKICEENAVVEYIVKMDKVRSYVKPSEWIARFYTLIVLVFLFDVGLKLNKHSLCRLPSELATDEHML